MILYLQWSPVAVAAPRATCLLTLVFQEPVSCFFSGFFMYLFIFPLNSDEIYQIEVITFSYLSGESISEWAYYNQTLQVSNEPGTFLGLEYFSSIKLVISF